MCLCLPSFQHEVAGRTSEGHRTSPLGSRAARQEMAQRRIPRDHRAPLISHAGHNSLLQLRRGITTPLSPALPAGGYGSQAPTTPPWVPSLAGAAHRTQGNVVLTRLPVYPRRTQLRSSPLKRRTGPAARKGAGLPSLSQNLHGPAHQPGSSPNLVLEGFMEASLLRFH